MSTAMKSSALAIASEALIWWPELGMGHHPAPPMDYEGDYWAAYRERDATPMGEALTRARVEMVRRHWDGQVVDVGIGGGRFVEAMGCKGFDVNPEAKTWLRERRAYCSPYWTALAITCWDSLEHIPEPDTLVRRVSGWVFVSMPIYRDAADCLASRHYKPGEHLWYWTHDGLIDWFERLGFEIAEHNEIESTIGRHGIHSYAFRRTTT